MDNEAKPTANEPIIGCTLVGHEFAERKEAIGRDLFSLVEHVEELDDGFAYRLPAGGAWAAKALDFITVERHCCPFFTFELVFEPNDGPRWLRLRGSDEIKAFIAAELDRAGLRPVTRRP